MSLVGELEVYHRKGKANRNRTVICHQTGLNGCL